MHRGRRHLHNMHFPDQMLYGLTAMPAGTNRLRLGPQAHVALGYRLAGRGA
jgi:hypothetical protein